MSDEARGTSDTSAPPEATAWPQILGVLEDGRLHRVLYSLDGKTSSVLVGHVIAERFRVERASADRVVLLDLRDRARQEIVIGWQGGQP